MPGSYGRVASRRGDKAPSVRRRDAGARARRLADGTRERTEARRSSEAFEAGYRHIDTATMYKNEGEERRRRDPAQRPRARGDLCDDQDPGRRGATRTDSSSRALRQSSASTTSSLISSTGPLPPRNTARSGARSRRCTNAASRARSGVSNFSRSRLESLLPEATHRPVVNQIEFNPFRYRRRFSSTAARTGSPSRPTAPLARAKVARQSGHRRPLLSVSTARRRRSSSAGRWQHGAIVIPKSSRRERDPRERADLRLRADRGGHARARRA